jgi:arginyl-tRNA synthetase
MNPFLDETARWLSGRLDLPEEEIRPRLEVPPELPLGDLAFPCFIAAKTLKKAPAAVAQGLRDAFSSTGMIDRVEAAGPYLNLFARRAPFARAIVASVDADHGRSDQGTGKTVVVEYSSPNIAKPFHAGHLRSTVIGHCLGRLHERLGYRVVRINYLGDWGTQYGMLACAWKRWGDEIKFQGHPIDHLYELYVRFNRECKEDPSAREEARLAFQRMEAGNPDALALWKRFRASSLEEFDSLYRLLGVSFDQVDGESKQAPKTEETIRWLSEKGLVQESEGALIVDLKPHQMTPALLRKQDGSSLYHTRDLAAARDRWARHPFDRMLYVVGAPQREHFQQLFKVLELSGAEWAGRCEQVPFGHYLGMSTREGTAIPLKEVLNEAIKKAEAKIRQAVSEGSVDLPGEEIPERARQVGIGAVIFNDLRTRRIKDVVFDWEELLNFHGRTGPYLQYAHARIRSILRKAGTVPPRTPPDGTLIEDPEHLLVRMTADFPRQIERAARECEPSILAQFLLDLAKAFSRFYDTCPVLRSEEPTRSARLRLAEATGTVLERGLHLLGLEAPDRM